MINGMIWVDRTGAPWRDMPERYGKWSSVASRFYRWQKTGLWQRIMNALQQQADRHQQLNWDIHFVDGTIVRAHQHAAGAAHSTAEQGALGRSRGGFSTKIHVRVDGNGKPMVLLLTAGQRHEAIVFEARMQQGAIKRAASGQLKRRPHRVAPIKATAAAPSAPTCVGTEFGTRFRISAMNTAPGRLTGNSIVRVIWWNVS